MKIKKIIILGFIVYAITGCDFTLENSYSTQIGSLGPKCLDSLAWETICKTHSVDNIKDTILLEQIEEMRKHWSNPKYILYFSEPPEELN